MTQLNKAAARTLLAATGTILIFIAVFVNMDTTAIIILLVLGYALSLPGCYLWVSLKNQHWIYTLWGILPVFGLFRIAALDDRSGGSKKAKR
jgi:cadmium resistance protein CadD (predicted permease)